MDVWKASCLEQRFEIASDEFRLLNRTSALRLEDEFARFCFGRSVFSLPSAKETTTTASWTRSRWPTRYTNSVERLG